MGNRNDNNRTIRNMGLILGIPLMFIVVFWLMFNNKAKTDSLVYSEYLSFFKREQVVDFKLDLGSGEMTLTLTPELAEKYKEDPELKKKVKLDKDDNLLYTVPNVSLFLEDIKEERAKLAADDKGKLYDYEPIQDLPWIVNMLPTLLLVGLVVVMYLMMRRSMASIDGGKAMGFGKARVKQPADEKRKTTFADVAGADEEKEELREIVHFLKMPKKFTELGARVPKGVLLVGPPGTGKTLLARAVAGEAGVPFFSISGSDFVEMYVGVGASRVRDLFDQAKKNAPCIVFVDEIDAVGRQRGAGLGGGHDEREQTLNQLLVEMDGFGANEGVIMIAATNRPDILDPALTRPGRFDRQIVVHYPDIKGREEILKVHARGKPLAPDVVLATIAKSTAGFTGADLENLLNEAALLAARKNLQAITMDEVQEATIKVVVGTEKRSHVVTEKDKRITAYHEAGHAVVTYYCPTQDPVHQVSIIPRGMAAGFTMHLPQEDRTHKLKTEMLEDIEVLLGGRVAEKLVLGDITTGAVNDIERATETARNMVVKYGMSDELGPVRFGTSDDAVFMGRDFGHTRNYSEEIAAKIDEEIKKIIENGYTESTRKLETHIDQVHMIANYLIENEKIEGEQFAEMMKQDPRPASDQPDYRLPGQW